MIKQPTPPHDSHPSPVEKMARIVSKEPGKAQLKASVFRELGEKALTS